MQLWTTTVASPDATARVARAREAAGLGWAAGGRLAKPVGRPLCRARYGGDGHKAARPWHRRDQQRDMPCRGDSPLDRQRPAPFRGAARCWASAAAILRSRISAVRRRGLAPFERYLRQLQAYLRGDQFRLTTSTSPSALRRRWRNWSLPMRRPPAVSAGSPKGHAKVPVEVAASGERVISIAARHADRVMFALGADEERIAWGIAGRARRAERCRAGPGWDQLSAPISLAAVIRTSPPRGI